MNSSARYCRSRSRQLALRGAVYLAAFLTLLTYTAVLVLSASSWAWTTAFVSISAFFAAVLELAEAHRCRQASLSRKHQPTS